jgi:hypothetical protein
LDSYLYAPASVQERIAFGIGKARVKSVAGLKKRLAILESIIDGGKRA